jgi:hypothetical protein
VLAGNVQKVALPMPLACRLRTTTGTGSAQLNGARATIIVGVTATTSAGSPPITTQFPTTGRHPLSDEMLAQSPSGPLPRIASNPVP